MINPLLHSSVAHNMHRLFSSQTIESLSQDKSSLKDQLEVANKKIQALDAQKKGL